MDRIARERRNNQNKDGFLICQTASQLKGENVAISQNQCPVPLVRRKQKNFGKSKRPLPLLRREFIMKKRHLQPQLKHIAMCIVAAVHRHRLFRHGIETAVRKNRNIMAVRMWHLPEKAERLLVL